MLCTLNISMITQHSLVFVNLSNNQIASTLPLHAQCPPTPTTLGNTWIKCK
jgi:hypothetical protein